MTKFNLKTVFSLLFQSYLATTLLRDRHRENNYGQGSRYLLETFFVLNVLSFFMNRIFSLVDQHYQRARTTFSSRREYGELDRKT